MLQNIKIRQLEMIKKLKRIFVKSFLTMEENHLKPWETMTR